MGVGGGVGLGNLHRVGAHLGSFLQKDLYNLEPCDLLNLPRFIYIHIYPADLLYISTPWPHSH